MRYLLDTNMLIAAMKKRPAVLSRMDGIPIMSAAQAVDRIDL